MPVAWHNPAPPLDRRNLALACIEIARDLRSAPLAQEAARLLTALPQDLAEDPVVLTALGSLLLQDRRPKAALKLFAEAEQEQPHEASNALREAIAYEATGDESDAIKELRQAIDLDPSFERAYFELARLYASLGQSSARTQVLRRYLEMFPGSIKGRVELTD
jgi:tetratricopeptide (TPR) repeat protein